MNYYKQAFKFQQAAQSTALAFSLNLVVVLAGANPAWGDLPLLSGQAVTSHFSGTINNVTEPVLQGPVLTVLDIRDPVGNGAPFAMPGFNNWLTPRYQHPAWKAETMGEVFGLALDTSQTQPDIYVISSSGMYFRNIAFNMIPGTLAGGGYGAVFKINGSTGEVSLLAALPSIPFLQGSHTRYAGLAQIAANSNARRLYVSNYEDGKIYVLDMANGTILESFDHGLQALIPSVADDGLAGFTSVGRRIAAVQYNPVEQRLYYVVWTATGNEVWSIAVSSGGTTTGSAQLEFSYASSAWEYQQAVLTDLAFNSTGTRLLAAEMPLIGGSYTRSSHSSTGIEWVGSSGSWALNTALEEGTGKIMVGTYSAGSNAAGAVAYGHNNYGASSGANEPCEDSMVLMGDALRFPSPFIYGLQISPLTGSGFSTIGEADYFIDLEGNTGNMENEDKSGLGDVEILTSCAPAAASSDLKLSKTVDNASPKRGDTVTYTLTLSNETEVAATGVKVTDNLPTGVTFVEVTPSQGTFTGSEWEVGTVAGNSSVTLILKVMAN